MTFILRSGILKERRRPRFLFSAKNEDVAMECKCKERRVHPTQMFSEFCLDCGRIWWNTLTGQFRPTSMYHKVSPPMTGVWVGQTFVTGPPELVSDLRKVSWG